MTHVPLSEAKAKLARLVREVEELGERVVITRSGRPAGVLLAMSDYEALLETLEVLADEELRSAVEEGLADVAAGRIVEHEELWGELDPALRR
ncbi:MAG TPA: type II toxin-antitoxin system Phd/YefM family antitoxin [Longimicrobiaceae bacterium]|nr:type II toxin-antitoxin system Phd/YefM family antitoxin [Longimicrobiaceae bacterium]